MKLNHPHYNCNLNWFIKQSYHVTNYSYHTFAVRKSKSVYNADITFDATHIIHTATVSSIITILIFGSIFRTITFYLKKWLLFWRFLNWLDTYFDKLDSWNVLASICHICLHLFGSYRYTCLHHHMNYQLIHLQNICILEYMICDVLRSSYIFWTLPKQFGCWKNPGLQSLHWSPSKLSLHKQIPLALQLDSTEPSGSHWHAEIVHNKYLHIMYNCTTLTNRFEIAYYCKMADLDRIDFGSQ